MNKEHVKKSGYDQTTKLTNNFFGSYTLRHYLEYINKEIVNFKWLQTSFIDASVILFVFAGILIKEYVNNRRKTEAGENLNNISTTGNC